MDCNKIISLKRKKEDTEYLKFYLFSRKIVCQSSKSSKLKEYKFKEKSKLEDELNNILKAKLDIGFSIVNNNIDPIFYNQFNEAMKGFDAMFENEMGIQYRFDRILDSDKNSYLRYFSCTDQKFLIEKFQGNRNLINLFSTFYNFDFRVDLNRHGMQYIYRCTIMYWDQVKWYNEEPDDKFNCELGKSIMAFMGDDDNSEKHKFWSSIIKKVNKSTPVKERYHFFTKGLILFLDSKTEKVYSVEEYEPSYDKPIGASDIVVHNTTVEYMSYVWSRLQEDVFYSMENK
jgi:hypothetical protein